MSASQAVSQHLEILEESQAPSDLSQPSEAPGVSCQVKVSGSVQDLDSQMELLEVGHP